MRHFRVKNFDKFQHYKSNTAVPTWIKMYASTLIDPEFLGLPDVSKAHLMLIWVIASQLRNKIRYDPKYVGQVIGANSKVDLEVLINAGFLEMADTTLECSENNSQSALERSTESTSPLISSPLISSSQEGESEGKPKEERFEPTDLMEAWNEMLAPVGLSKVDILSATRKAKAAKRLDEHPSDAFWSQVLTNIQNSSFLRGLSKPRKPDERPFKASFDWLIENDTNVVKVYEGRYNGNG